MGARKIRVEWNEKKHRWAVSEINVKGEVENTNYYFSLSKAKREAELFVRAEIEYVKPKKDIPEWFD